MNQSIPSGVSENKLPRLFLLSKHRVLRNHPDSLDMAVGTGSWTTEGEKGKRKLLVRKTETV